MKKVVTYISMYVHPYVSRRFAELPSLIHQGPYRISRAITLVELLIVMAIMGTLAAIGVPAYDNYVDKARNCQALEDIYAIQKSIAVYVVENGTLPDSLDQALWPRRLDPWGNPYQYLKIEGRPKNEVVGSWRKDRFLVPLNTDYDLYSMGKDGKSRPPLTAKTSRDDIVRANNGTFVGLASEY
jgi:general secretion pathway protein G